MGDHDMVPTCLSAEDHEPRDPMLHYLGCLEFSERNQYLVEVSSEYQEQVDRELRRIEYLREVLKKDPVEHRLVKNMKDSMEKWKESSLYTSDHGIKAVRAWRKAKHQANRSEITPVQPGESIHQAQDYDPDVDINAYLTRFEDSKPVKKLNDKRFDGHFPNHKIPVSHLLNDENSSPLTKTPPKSATEATQERIISYFHLPANNMIVSFVYLESPFFQYSPFLNRSWR